MYTIKEFLFGVIIVALGAFAGVAVAFTTLHLASTASQQAPSVRFGSASDPNKWQVTGSVSSASVGPQQTTRVVATSTARQWVALSTAGTAVWCNMSDASSSVNVGFEIPANTTSEIVTAEHLYTGSIECSASASTTIGLTAQQ